jgi:hypothetical protein
VIAGGGQACGGEQAGQPERRATLLGSLRSLAAARLAWSFAKTIADSQRGGLNRIPIHVR